MADKKPGYQYNIFDQISDNNKKNTQKIFQEAIAKIEREYSERIARKERDIAALRAYDPDDMDAETRRDIRIEEDGLKEIEKERDEKIAKILKQYPNLTESR